MSAEIIDIGRYIKVPYELVVSTLSHRAFRVWSLIAAGASPEQPSAEVRQSELAQKLGCSTDTIGRAIAELVKQGLLCEAGKWNNGRCKVYRINWSPRQKIDDEPKELPSATAKELDEVLATHGVLWAKAYECFDGEGGRPSLRACVEEALSNASRAKDADVKAFIDGWLHIASQRWRVKPAATPVPVPAAPLRPGERPESEEERQWIISQIKHDNEMTRRKEAMEARKRAAYNPRGAPAPEEPVAEKPICPENYPLSWAFLRIKWAESSRNAAA